MIVFITVIGFLFIKKNIFDHDTIRPSFALISIGKEFFHFSSPLIVYTSVGLCSSYLDIWLLQKLGGSIQSGFYGLAYSIVAASFLFTSAMTPIITREFSRSFEKNDINQIQKNFYRYIPMLYSIAAFFGIFLSFQSENILFLFTDQKFKDTYLVLVIMSFYPLHQTYGQLSGSIFYVTGQTKLYRNIGIISMLFGLNISILFIFYFNLGAIGLALKMIIMQFILTNIQLYFNAKFLHMSLKYFIWHQLYSIAFFSTIAYGATSMVAFTHNHLLNLTLSFILYIFFVTVFTYVFPQIFATNRDEIRFYMLKFTNKRNQI
jgi:O-antigen/teichoic acid export membrane protein